MYSDREITNKEFAIYKRVIGIALKDYRLVTRGKFSLFMEIFILDMISSRMLYRFTTKFENDYTNSNELSTSHVARMIVTFFIAISLLLLSVF